MTSKLRKVLAENVRALLRAEVRLKPGADIGVSHLMQKGLPNGTAQRVLAGETSVGLDKLEDIAEAFRLEPWQLLIPDLDPANVPGLAEDRTSWPLPLVDQEAYWNLTEVDRAFVQGKMAQMVEDRSKRNPPKRPAT